MTDKMEATWMQNLFRGLGRFFDGIVYWLLGIMYQIFFNVASAELFTNETVKNFYGRIQLIIGVFMIFKLAVSIVKGIVNPDTFTDKKSGGANIITRVIFALVMLTITVPINIPNASSEYEIQLNNNGLLFGTLYSLQHRILENNTLGRLILGTSDSLHESEGNNSENKMKDAADLFTATILKGFVRINVVDENKPETEKSNWICGEKVTKDALEVYTDVTAGYDEILALTTLTCETEKFPIPFVNSTEMYMFSYKPFISLIVGGFFVYILLNFTIDIAVRAIKLAILRLVAPIPIISYIDPGTGAKTFESWTKNLTSTYIDLFLRLAIIYLVIFVVQDMTINGYVINVGTGPIGIFSFIFIVLGLFIFAKQAPKFIKQVFGMKDDGGKIFSGLGEAIGLGAVGAIGAGVAGWRAASEENDALHEGQGVRNFFRNSGSALLNGITGGYKGINAAIDAKDHRSSAAIKALQQHNAQRAAHSTYGGRFADSSYSMLHGQSLATKNQNVLDANKKAADALAKYKSTAVGEAKKKGDYGVLTDAKKYGALTGIKFNYAELEASMQAKNQNGDFTYVDRDGKSHALNVREFNSNVMAGIEDAQTSRFMEENFKIGKGDEFENGKLQDAWGYAKQAIGDSDAVSYTGDFMAYDDIGKQIGEANNAARSQATGMKNIMARANNQANKK